MKTCTTTAFRVHLFVIAALIAAPSAYAQNGTYTSTNGAWNVAGSWASSITANGTDNFAYFTNEITANQNTSLGVNRTIGNIVFTDPTPSHDRTLSNNILTLDVTTGTPIIDVTNRALTIGSQISGSDGLQKNGGGTLVLTSNLNNFTGTIRVTQGLLQVGVNNGRLGNVANGIEVSSGAVLYLGNGGTINTGTRALTINGNGINDGDSQNTAFGALRMDTSSTVGGTITLAGNSRIGGAVFSAPNTSNNTLSGQITGGFGIDFFGAAAFTTNGTVNYLLSNTGNNYTGNTTITNGAYNSTTITSRTNLRLGASNVIPNGASAGNVVFALSGNNTLSTVALDLNGFSETINGLTVNPGSFTSRITNGSTTVASVLTVGDNNTTSAFSGIIEDSNATNNLGITKIGTGTLTLSGANTYRGATTVSGGTLLVNGSLAAGSAVSVGLSGSLGGNGTINGATTVNGLLAPGNSPGVLTFNSTLTLGGNTTLEIDGTTTRGTDFDGVNTVGLLTYGGGLTFDFGTTLSGNETFDLFNIGVGGQTGNFTSVVLTGNYTGSFSQNGTVWELTDGGGNNWSFSQTTGDLTFVAVPEPTAIALLGSAVGLLGLRAARRRKA